MRISTYFGRKLIACFLVWLLTFPLTEISAAMPRQAVSDQQSPTAPSVQTEPQDTGSPSPIQQASTPQSGADQQNGVTKPVGTAAAPLEKPSGVTASRPAGAVIAPAKQRRARAILIRVGIVVGAAVAVGTVVALSRASPSRPN
jgi:hypothetical protein